MSNELKVISIEEIPNVLDEINAAFEDIPFENSAFQTRAFVVAAQITPARAYRAIGLQMHSKIQAVKEHLFNQEKNKIDREEIEWKITQDFTNEFEKRRLRLELAKLNDGQAYGVKLLNDALETLNVLYDEFKKLPRYTREQFESEERKHFSNRLERQLKLPGALESLANMNDDLPNWNTRIRESAAQLSDMSEFKRKLGIAVV